MVDLEKELKLLLKTGKCNYGYKEVLEALYHKKVLGIILASKIPKEIYSKILYYAKLAEVPVYIFNGSSMELGNLCGKKFPITSIAIISPGESNILELFKT
ncbi:MAG: 50S ribosomal protein L30e [Thermoproteota archaeon]|jgi:large subunit ribosomal protein L30e|nr:50S ribosomal protein L30e [Thermoproteota archaeon]